MEWSAIKRHSRDGPQSWCGPHLPGHLCEMTETTVIVCALLRINAVDGEWGRMVRCDGADGGWSWASGGGVGVV